MIRITSSINKQFLTSLSSHIEDASFIGLDCPSGDVSDCNDGTLKSARNVSMGALILSDEESQCGSKCCFGSNQRSSQNENRKKWWTLFTRQALENLSQFLILVIIVSVENLKPF